jgi:hypothetical protein
LSDPFAAQPRAALIVYRQPVFVKSIAREDSPHGGQPLVERLSIFDAGCDSTRLMSGARTQMTEAMLPSLFLRRASRLTG